MMNKPAPTWTDAVAAVLGDRDPQRKVMFDTDATVVIAALKALVATGRCVATGPNAAFQPIRALRVVTQAAPGEAPHTSTKRDKRHFARWAIALEGERGSWIANVTSMTYLPSRRGAPAERAVFHLTLGRVIGQPFINEEDLPAPQLYFSSGWLLLTDADLDVPWLLSGGVDPSDLGSLGEAVIGKPRASFVPVEERRRKEEVIAAVRAAYLAHRGAMPRALRQDDVDVIVRTGLDHGALINLDLVHAATGGRGSPNAVYPKLADAMQRLAPRRPTATDVDPALLELWQQLGQAATAAAEEALAPVRQALALERTAVTAEQVELNTEREQEARAAEERQRQKARLEQELDDARTRIDSLTHVERGQLIEIEGLKHDRGQLQLQLTAVRDDLVTLQGTHSRVQEERDRAVTELAEMRRVTTRQQELSRAELARVTADLQRETVVVRDLQKQLSKTQVLMEQHAEARETWVAERQALARTVEQLTAETRAAQTAATEVRRELTEWRLRHDEVAAARVHATDTLATLRAEHQAVTRERDRLVALLERLSAAKPMKVSPPKGN